ncbi:T9SS type A sorting domain-containing protein [Dyadobacter sp. CY323]|uniref:T9SS type A sorting domain-containing protein n=1 Tax=Dyadobacter sp. CY323 TaxID=2907302 RepID=UPI001F34E11E|nr:T9SS type A sorting domain-containing protein [Dyadobacter sp. CY323]MCE6988130.1 T9SS type A sorting domain-containing protein [Dyadobacter sp. CY323]
MKHVSLSSILLFCLIKIPLVVSAQTPRIHRNDITIRPFYKIDDTDTQTRIVYDATDKSFYTISWNGDLYQIKPGADRGYSHQRLANADDHAISYLQGLALKDGTIYLVGNVVIKQGVSGYGKAVKAKITGSKLVWTEVFRTAEHASSKTLYDHAFSAICFSPDGKDMFIASGSRTDHGEVKDNEGLYPNLREIALTSCIFKLPATTQNLVLSNDSASLAPYIYVRGVRNAFSIAFAANGDFFSVENSGDRDDPEEMNWIRPGAHYGFPWEMGANDTPQQFSGYKVEEDKLLNHAYTGYKIGAFYDDKTFPKKPANLVFRKPIQNAGPDADKIRDAATGKVTDASDNGKTISTFTAHRSPLGLVFDVAGGLGGEYKGKGFVLNYQAGSESYGPMQDPGQDLVLLNLKKNDAGDDYTLNAYSIATEFREPTDARIVDNKLYVLEGRGQIWELSFPKELVTATQFPAGRPFKIYPNPSQNNMLIELPFTQNAAEIQVLDISGRLLIKQSQKLIDGQTQLDISSLRSGIYMLKVATQSQQLTTRFLVNP